MTSDLETTTDDLYNTIRALWWDAPDGSATVTDTAIASSTGLDLDVVREYLDNAHGVQLVTERDGDTRSVTGLLE
ncbi:hypothetical protein JCM18899A_41450 [Nocardioides sp. AN3]